MKWLMLFWLMPFLPGFSSAQDTALSAQSQGNQKLHKVTWKHLGINFDDDYLNFAGRGTDGYYTAGWQLDAYYQRNTKDKNWMEQLLISLPNAENLYYYGLSRKLFTASDISQSEILYGDRPYASVLILQHGQISANLDKKECLTSTMGLGAMGPVTLGGSVQTWFHQLIGYQKPMGWKNQIRNSPIIDYQINYEKQLIRPAPHFIVMGNVDCESGTLADHIGMGITVGFGSMNHFFAGNHLQPVRPGSTGKKFMIHFFMHPELRVVMYDATLEGGFFSSTDPYVIDPKDLKYVYLKYDFGVVMGYKGFGFSITQMLRTAEFKTGSIHQVGSLLLSVPF